MAKINLRGIYISDKIDFNFLSFENIFYKCNDILKYNIKGQYDITMPRFSGKSSLSVMLGEMYNLNIAVDNKTSLSRVGKNGIFIKDLLFINHDWLIFDNVSDENMDFFKYYKGFGLKNYIRFYTPCK